jgi:TolB-like protein/Tfp pilus assembly protein PilF
MPRGERRANPQESSNAIQPGKDSGLRAFLGKLKKRKIIETLAAFIGGGWLILEFVHWLLVDHYHFPEKTIDITFITILGTLLCTLIWRWFSGREKPRRFNLELVLIPLVVLITVLLDINLLRHLKIPESETFPAAKWKNSIAVLPFDNISPEQGQDYFCDGLTDELITRLSKIKDLKVIAKTSAFSFKGKDIDIRDVGKKLNVATVLEGGVRKAGNKLRITAQLINVADASHLWSDTYDREITDIFAIQEGIALAVADRLKLILLSEEKTKLTKRPTENLEAYNLYLVGRYFFYRFSEESCKKAIGYFEQAIAKDPRYALAYVDLANCYALHCSEGWMSPREGNSKAMAAAMKALELDDSLGEAHAALGMIKLFFNWDVAGAEVEFQRAIKLSPGSTDLYIPYSYYLAITGRFDKSIAGYKRALELDPATPATSYGLGGIGYGIAGRYEEAIAQLKKSLSMDPNFYYAQIYLAIDYALMGKYPEAIDQANKTIASQKTIEDPTLLAWLGWVYAVSRRQEISQKFVKNLLDLRERRYVDAYYVAIIYAGLGEKDKAFEWLNKGYEERACRMIWLKTDPVLNNLRSDPRYHELLKRMRFVK